MVNRGDVWWYEPPDAKRRPALVMTRTEAAQSLNELQGDKDARILIARSGDRLKR